MKRKILSSILTTSLLFMALACSDSSTDVCEQADKIKKDAQLEFCDQNPNCSYCSEDNILLREIIDDVASFECTGLYKDEAQECVNDSQKCKEDYTRVYISCDYE